MSAREYIIDVIESKSYIHTEHADHTQSTDLDQYLSQTDISTEIFLQLSIELVNALDVLHKNKIIHNHLSSSSIYVYPETLEVMITGFNDNTVNEEHILYQAPEENDHIDHPVSDATDIYALGIIFYQILTGATPFDHQDEISMLHNQIAKNALSLHEVKRDIPIVLSNIVDKMMMKTPNERYSKCISLVYDLRKCFFSFQKEQIIKEFDLDSIGKKYSINKTRKTYGVDKERQQLERFIRSSYHHLTSIVLLKGNSGTGKSTLLWSVLEQSHEYFGHILEGKFEQYRQYNSYDILYGLFSDLMKQVLCQDEVFLDGLRKKIRDSLGDEAQVLVEVIPSLELLIGPQPAVEMLSATDSKARLDNLLSNLIQLFASKRKPLCIVIEDMQWVDEATIQWLKIAALELSNIVILITYRDENVDNEHLLSTTLDDIKRCGVTIEEITLHNLSKLTIEELILDRTQLSEAAAVATVIFKRTQGNLFFVMQYIRLLEQDESIWFDEHDLLWHCDVAKVERLSISKNVVEFLETRITALTENVQRLLKIASCIGNSFDLNVLANVYGNDELLSASLEQALSKEWLIKQESDNSFSEQYRFSHDRMQQAAHSLLSEEKKRITHLKIGEYIVKKNDGLENEDLFSCTNHYNKAYRSVTDKKQLDYIAQLNYRASLESKKTGDYRMSLHYIENSMRILPALLGIATYSDVYKERAECERLNSHPDEAIKYYELAIKESASLLQKAGVYELMITFYSDNAEFKKAYAIGRIATRLFDLTLPSKFIPPLLVRDYLTLSFRLRTYTPFELLELPEAKDENIRLLIRILSSVLKVAYQIRPELSVAISLKLVTLCLKHGNTREAVVGYMVFGVIFQGGILGNHRRGFEYGQLSLKMLDKFNNRLQRSEVEFVYNYFSNSWKNSVFDTEKNWYRAYEHGLQIGDWFHAGCAGAAIIQNMFMRGESLDKILAEIKPFEVTLRRIGANEQLGAIEGIRQAVYNLKNKTDSVLSFSDKDFDESLYVQRLKGYGSRHFAHYYFINKMITLYLHGQYESAYAMSLESRYYLSDSKGMLHSTEHYFYQALSAAKLYSKATLLERYRYKKVILKTIKRFRAYALESPDNFLSRSALLEGELFYITHDLSQAFSAYESAVETSKVYKQNNIQAIANSAIASMYAGVKQMNAADVYASEAHRCFLGWGTNIKRNALLSENRTISSDLNLTTLIKASEAIAKEQRLPSLLKTLIKIIVENAGAQYGALLLKEEGTYLIKAEASVDSEYINVMHNTPFSDSKALAKSVVNYVIHTQDTIILDHAKKSLIFGKDRSVIERDVKSLLCMPLIIHGQSRGLIYLENNVLSAAFTHERSSLLKHLSGQIIISVENATLYDNLEEKIVERTKDLDLKNRELTTAMEKLDLLAAIDSLTGLKNRRIFDEYLRQECDRSNRGSDPLALIICDIDAFKLYNDNYGHQQGDHCLKAVADAIKASTSRVGDLVARYGGEEFAIVMSHTDLNGALKVANDIHENLKQLHLPHITSPTSDHVTISIGIAISKPAQRCRPEQIIQLADKALYEVKSTGRSSTKYHYLEEVNGHLQSKD